MATSTEWGVQWDSDPQDVEQGQPEQIAQDGGEAYARRVVKQYRSDGARLVQREVRRGPWEASS